MQDNFPSYRSELEYQCLGCGATFPQDELLYTCSKCHGVFLLQDKNFNKLKEKSGTEWQKIFDERKLSHNSALQGIFRFYELIAPVLNEEDIVYLGEGNTPIVEAAKYLENSLGQKFAFKNDGQNPSASFKDRGMACAFSYIQALIRKHNWTELLTICASTGDTSAAAAQYAAYIGAPLKSIVLLPQNKVTSQQMAQPLAYGASVIEIPGVFDDCMKLVEYMAENYQVALLNSKNSWRILGQESYIYELAQHFSWNLAKKAVFVPIGNAGNISAILSGLLKLYKLGIITELPKLIGCQSEHANPVFKYYIQDKKDRKYEPVKVRPSVAQAAMIGNPVSFPRVHALVQEFEELGGFFRVVEVSEQAIIEATILASKNGHIACTQGGECLAAMIQAKRQKLINTDDYAVLDATAHSIKFSSFTDMYFNNSFAPEFEIIPDPNKANKAIQVSSEAEKNQLNYADFISKSAQEIAKILNLAKNK